MPRKDEEDPGGGTTEPVGEKDQSMRDFAAHLRVLWKQQARRQFPLSRIAKLNELRREAGRGLFVK